MGSPPQIYPLAAIIVPAFFREVVRMRLPLTVVLSKSFILLSQDCSRKQIIRGLSLGQLFSFLISLYVILTEFECLRSGQVFAFHFLYVCIQKGFHRFGPSGVFLF